MDKRLWSTPCAGQATHHAGGALLSELLLADEAWPWSRWWLTYDTHFQLDLIVTLALFDSGQAGVTVRLALPVAK